jgi:hypothetical protein
LADFVVTLGVDTLAKVKTLAGANNAAGALKALEKVALP